MGSTTLTGAVALVLGVAIGVIGVLAVKNTVSPSASTVATQQQSQDDSTVTKPQTYGSR